MYDPLAGLLVDAATVDDLARYPSAAVRDPMIGAVAVRDTDLPGLPGLPDGGPALSVLLTGGAGQLAGPAGLCARRGLPLAAVTVALRDPGDLPGNARRVVAAVDDARGSGALADEVTVRVALPAEPASAGWLAAADEIAAAELEAALAVSHAAPAAVAEWIDALLDRETGFAASADGSGPAGPTGWVLGLLAATTAAWNGSTNDQVAALLAEPPTRPADLAELSPGRRWCRAVVVPDAVATAADLRGDPT